MRRIVVLAGLILTVAAGGLSAGDRNGLARVVVPDDQEAAVKVLHEWLESRAIETEQRAGYLLLRKGGVLMNITPLVYKGELDRLRVVTFYEAKEEHKGSKELEQLAAKLNRAQNFLQVFI